MLSSIHPLGERGRRNNFMTTAMAFVVGSVLGGSLTGALLGALGWLVALVAPQSAEQTRLAAVLVVAIIALGFDLSGRTLPSVKRQVNEDWLGEFRGWVYGAGFGIQLGAGVTTYITSAAVLLWLFAMTVVGSVAAAIAIGATFGLARGCSVYFARSIDSPEQLVAFHRRLHSSAPTVRLATRAAHLGLTAVTAVLVIASAR